MKIGSFWWWGIVFIFIVGGVLIGVKFGGATW